uniref:Uncharacterized protein orf-1 n=1 Tax=Streptomyces phage phiK38-1 TaxID=374421 RepID=Q0KKB0_9VIRU|nr:hypothetical protein [Streptomyces phage phiK38-1]
MSGEIPSYEDERWWLCYGRFFDHISPSQPGAEGCEACTLADTPRNGCEVGVALWDDYRLARIEKRGKGAQTAA